MRPHSSQVVQVYCGGTVRLKAGETQNQQKAHAMRGRIGCRHSVVQAQPQDVLAGQADGASLFPHCTCTSWDWAHEFEGTQHPCILCCLSLPTPRAFDPPLTHITGNMVNRSGFSLKIGSTHSPAPASPLLPDPCWGAAPALVRISVSASSSEANMLCRPVSESESEVVLSSCHWEEGLAVAPACCGCWLLVSREQSAWAFRRLSKDVG